MSSVVDIDDYRPHMCIEGPGRVHVIPVAMIQNIIDGEMSVNDIEDPQNPKTPKPQNPKTPKSLINIDSNKAYFDSTSDKKKDTLIKDVNFNLFEKLC